MTVTTWYITVDIRPYNCTVCCWSLSVSIVSTEMNSYDWGRQLGRVHVLSVLSIWVEAVLWMTISADRNEQLTNQMTKPILEKRIFARMVSKFVTFDDIPMYVVAFTRACDQIQQICSREVTSFLGCDALSLGCQVPTFRTLVYSLCLVSMQE